MRLKRSERRLALVQYLTENPFATDEQLAEKFGVSVATIRLDRAGLHIPEARERIRRLAAGGHDAVRSLETQEVVGELVELQLNRYAISVLNVLPIHVFARTEIMRGHFLFAQVNSLAIAVMDTDVALTAKSQLRFYRPVKLGETVTARADVIANRADIVKCRVYAESDEDVVLDGAVWVVTNLVHLREFSE